MPNTVRLHRVLLAHLEQAGIPDSIPLAMCYFGWQESLGKLVEPEIRQ